MQISPQRIIHNIEVCEEITPFWIIYVDSGFDCIMCLSVVFLLPSTIICFSNGDFDGWYFLTYSFAFLYQNLLSADAGALLTFGWGLYGQVRLPC